MYDGYVKLYRKSLNSSVWKNPVVWMVWSWCLMKANHEPHNFPFNGTDIEIKRGQFITGIFKAIKEIPISAQNHRTAITYLKSTNRITVKSTNKFSLITIIKWEQYQSNDIKLTSKLTDKLTNHSQATNKPLTTYKNDKNDNNEKNISKDIVITSYGNEDINSLMEYLREKIGGTPDGSVKDNRRFASLLINRFKKDYPDKSPVDLISQLIDAGLADAFHSKNITSFKYLYYHAQQIIQSLKNNLTKNKSKDYDK